ncbi:MAG: chemotaxis protein CheW, partial [Alphaproteobacteria bacterium]|nr:chemotaxis protein CheW [Alphaproteobacteria bacterium]
MSDIAIADSRELAMIDEEQLVTMMVDGQAFGIPILKVQDIVEPDQITPVPLAPGAIAGVLNLRGRIVTVIDMRELLGSKGPEDQDKQMSVTVEHRGDLYTFLVDSIGDVRSLPRKHFDKPPATLDENLRRLCSGVFRLEDDLLVVLDVERMLDEETIMKTPRRTRRRRVKSKDKVANENATENAAAAEAAEGESVKKPEGTRDSGSLKTASGATSSAESNIKAKPKTEVKASTPPKPAVKPEPKPSVS